MLEISFLMENVHDRQMGVQGTEGRLWVQYSEGERIHVIQANGKTFEVDEPGELRGGLFRDFLDCIAEGNEPLVGGAKARQSLLVPLAGEISMAEKRVVQISELESAAKGPQ
jgi:predicted dehydrogenase